ncbi:MAG: arsenite methyltransferase [Bacteroidetes bacterium]|nr:arsenite methyltransferase [Bacteroidota bacterium]
MQTNEEIKNEVKKKYGQIANQSKEQNKQSCCGSGESCGTIDYSVFSDDYSKIEGYMPDADLGLGCGLPTKFALINEGDIVLDLGSGAGNDCFVARQIVGKEGKVIGLDFTESMIEKARINADKLGYKNVEFRLGEIENMPIGGKSIDVIVSNCVMNLVPDKQKAFSEAFRVLAPGGHFSISDVVLRGKLPESFVKDAELWAGCVSGAMQMDEYLNLIEDAGFRNIKVQTEKKIDLPDQVLYDNFPKDLVDEFKQSNTGIYSITVYAEKPCSDCGCSCC